MYWPAVVFGRVDMTRSRPDALRRHGDLTGQAGDAQGFVVHVNLCSRIVVIDGGVMHAVKFAAHKIAESMRIPVVR